MPGVACEGAGADPAEQKCETATAKALSKLVDGVIKCYDKCKKNERKGAVAPGSCDPPTALCISTADNKSIAAIDKVGVDPAKADCTSPDDYPSGATWTNLVDVAIGGNIPNTYGE